MFNPYLNCEHHLISSVFSFFFFTYFNYRSAAMARRRHRRSRKNSYPWRKYILERTIQGFLCYFCVLIVLFSEIVRSEYTDIEAVTETLTDSFINDLDRPSKWPNYFLCSISTLDTMIFLSFLVVIFCVIAYHEKYLSTQLVYYFCPLLIDVVMENIDVGNCAYLALIHKCTES